MFTFSVKFKHYFPWRPLGDCNKSFPEDSKLLNSLSEWNKLLQLYLNECISINI